jgi:hypothetical protein
MSVVLFLLSALAVGTASRSIAAVNTPDSEGQRVSDRDSELLRAVERRYLGAHRGRKVVRYEGDTVIERDAYIDGDVIVMRGDIEIAGEVDGSVVAVFGDIVVSRDGAVHGDVVSVDGEVHRHRRAIIDGDIVETTVAALRGYSSRAEFVEQQKRKRRRMVRRTFKREFWDEDQDVLLVRYNRVEGLFAGLRLPRTFDPRREVVDFGLYGEVGYGFRSKAWRYRVGAEISAFSGPPRMTPFLMTFGAEAHDLTDTQDRWIIPEFENSLAAFFFKKDYMDFYRRKGWSIYVTQRVAGVLSLTGRFLSDDFESLSNRTNWALFGGDDFRPNPAIDEGRINSLRGELRLDSRDSRTFPHQGWLITALAERAGGEFLGQYDFQRYLVDLRRYQPLPGGDRLDVRLRAGTAKGFLPGQYLYDLGGLSTLRGYGFKEFTGDRLLLSNVEYWVDADRRMGDAWLFGDLNLVLLFDAGLAWFASDPTDPFDDFGNLRDRNIRTSVGLAIASEDGNFRIEFVKALDVSGRKVAVTVRASRPF